MKKKLLFALLFGLIGAIGGVFIGLYQIQTHSEEMIEEILKQVGSLDIFIMVTGLQAGVLTSVATFFGLIFTEKLGLHLYRGIHKKGLICALLVGVGSAAFIVFSDLLFFHTLLGDHVTDYQINIFYLLGGLIYGGVVEELLLRLFVMSGIVIMIQKFGLKQKDHTVQKRWVYVTAIVTSALIFGALHLPATALLFELSFGIVLRALLLNGLPGIAFGYLFWKYDLTHAIIAHAFTHVVMQLVLMPIFF